MDIHSIQWYGKSNCSQKARKTGGMDVTVSKSICNGKPKVRFTLRNGIYDLVSETDRIQYGMSDKTDPRRIYFTTGTEKNGLKLSATHGSKAEIRYVAINKENEITRLLPFVGDYELSYDDECKLYYIERR